MFIRYQRPRSWARHTWDYLSGGHARYRRKRVAFFYRGNGNGTGIWEAIWLPEQDRRTRFLGETGRDRGTGQEIVRENCLEIGRECRRGCRREGEWSGMLSLFCLSRHSRQTCRHHLSPQRPCLSCRVRVCFWFL